MAHFRQAIEDAIDAYEQHFKVSGCSLLGGQTMPAHRANDVQHLRNILSDEDKSDAWLRQAVDLYVNRFMQSGFSMFGHQFNSGCGRLISRLRGVLNRPQFSVEYLTASASMSESVDLRNLETLSGDALTKALNEKYMLENKDLHEKLAEAKNKNHELFMLNKKLSKKLAYKAGDIDSSTESESSESYSDDSSSFSFNGSGEYAENVSSDNVYPLRADSRR